MHNTKLKCEETSSQCQKMKELRLLILNKHCEDGERKESRCATGGRYTTVESKDTTRQDQNSSLVEQLTDDQHITIVDNANSRTIIEISGYDVYLHRHELRTIVKVIENYSIAYPYKKCFH